MNNSCGKIFVISAPSGAGKSTLARVILESYPEVRFSVSATTRGKREGEEEGVNYFFISETEFKRKIKEDCFVEWERFYDYYYGTLKSFVDDSLRMGKSILFEVDVKGALNIKAKYPSAELIYVVPPSVEALGRRLKARNTETPEDLKKRLERAEMEIGFKDRFDHLIYNADLEKAKEDIKNLMHKLLHGEEK